MWQLRLETQRSGAINTSFENDTCKGIYNYTYHHEQ